MADPSFASVSLLCHFNGTNGSTTFTDLSTNTKTLTASGAAAISTAQSQFGGASLATGTNNFVTVSTSTDFDFGSGDFTIEFWFYRSSSPDYAYIIRRAPASGNYPFSIYFDPFAAKLNFAGFNASGTFFSAQPKYALNGGWNHIALVRNGGSITLYSNGFGGTPVSVTGALVSTTADITIGALANGTYPLLGYVDELRITKGVARYTSDFTPPTTEFETGGIILSGVSAPGSVGSISSSRSVALTAASVAGSAGNVSYAGSPVTAALSGVTATTTTGLFFARTLQSNQTLLNFAQVARANGGGAEANDPYFQSVTLLLHADVVDSGVVFADASSRHNWASTFGNFTGSSNAPKIGSYCAYTTAGGLEIQDPTAFDFGAGDFTVEGWAKTATPTTGTMYGGLVAGATATSAGPRVSVDASGRLQAACNDSGGASFGLCAGGTVPTSTWFHWAYTRVGSSFQLWLNGVQVGSTATSSTACGPTGHIVLGNNVIGTYSDNWNGFLDEIRVTKGTGRYTSNFTAPTAAFGETGSLAVLNASASQTLPAFTQNATVYGAGFRSAVQDITVDPFTQVATVSPPSRVISGASTIALSQIATVITTADRNLIVPGDLYYDNVAYLLHCDTVSIDAIDPSIRHTPDASKNAFVTDGQNFSVQNDSSAFGGKAIQFFKTSASYLRQTNLALSVPDRTKSTTELRVRFDVLNGVVVGTLVPGSANDYTFDATKQQTGWFFTSGGEYGAINSIQLGLAGANGLYEADWTTISASGSSIDFSPYVLQIKGFSRNVGTSYTINQHGTHPVTVGWHTVTIVRDGTLVAIYLDGVFDCSYVLQGSTDPLFDETFVIGADTSQGFGFKPEHTNLSAADELRHTWGVARYPYPGPFKPATEAFYERYKDFGAFTQSANIFGSAAGPRSLSANQTFVFAQNASIFGGPPIAASADQTLPAFAQAATIYGQGGRLVGASQQLAPPAQLATVAPGRIVDANITPQQLALPLQNATVSSKLAATAAQTFAFNQAAAAAHTPDGAIENATFAFTQLATASTLLALAQGQIIAPFTQATQFGAIAKLQGASNLGLFLPAATVEGATITNSLRGYRVRPEARTYVTS